MIEREDACGISYDSGLAFPHMRHPELQDLDIGIGILRTPVRLREHDKADTRVILCCMISETTSVIYLKALAAFSKYLSIKISNCGASFHPCSFRSAPGPGPLSKACAGRKAAAAPLRPQGLQAPPEG